MRVISGIYGGRRLDSKVPANTRPTSDRVRESIFDVLSNLIDFESAIILDLFAGTGMLGIEALSRGATHLTFVDKSKQAIAFIKNSLEKLGIAKEYYNVVNSDAVKFIEKEQSQFDIIFLDPPYASGIYNDIFLAVSSQDILKTNGIIVSERGKSPGVAIPEEFHLITTKSFGDTLVDFLELAE